MGLYHDKLINILKERQSVKINYYPPCPQADELLGISPHSDAVGLTLLHQINEVPGLQIKRNGRWMSINPIPGAFIVNIGDVLEVMNASAIYFNYIISGVMYFFQYIQQGTLWNICVRGGCQKMINICKEVFLPGVKHSNCQGKKEEVIEVISIE